MFNLPFRMPTFDGEGNRSEPMDFEALAAELDVLNARDRETAVAILVENGVLHICVGCGCSEVEPCPEGCIWIADNRCSRCAD